jgi:hypothetical protein
MATPNTYVGDSAYTCCDRAVVGRSRDCICTCFETFFMKFGRISALQRKSLTLFARLTLGSYLRKLPSHFHMPNCFVTVCRMFLLLRCLYPRPTGLLTKKPSSVDRPAASKTPRHTRAIPARHAWLTSNPHRSSF